MNAIDHFDQGWRLNPAAACLIDGETGRTLSYGEVRALTLRVGNALHEHGFGVGMHAAVLSGNAADSYAVVLGLFRAGLVWLPLNPRHAAADNAALLQRMDCDVVFYQQAFAADLALMQYLAPRVKAWVCIDGQAVAADAGLPTLTQWLGRWARTDDLPEIVLSPDPERVFAIQTTGGTTGEPKGVVMPTRVLQFIVDTFLTVAPCTQRPVFLAAAPLTHAAGMVLQHLLARGGSAVVMARPDKQAMLDAIPRHRVTHLFLPPTVIYELLAQPGVRERDYGSLRYFFYGASPMAPDKLREAITVFGPVMAQIYGQTEAGVPLTFLSPADHLQDGQPAPEARLASAGRPTPFAQVAIVGNDGTLLPPGQAGEVAVRGAGVMAGYFRDEAATAQVRRDGWLLTGDVGRFDDDGLLHIVDRTRDIIISGGFNIYSSEVERAVLAHAAVQDCAVIGVPDAKWGEAVCAVVQRKPGASLDAADLVAHCKALLGSMKAPKRVDFVDTLPRSAVGKVLKREIKTTYWRDQARMVS